MQDSQKWTEELSLIGSILDKAPLDKGIKWGAEVYSFEGRNVVSYGGFKNYFTIWFYNGVFLKDTYGVLVSAQDKTKSLRQWRFTSYDEIDEKRILEYVTEAIAVEKKGLKIKPEKFAPVELPLLLKEAFERDKAFHSGFERLTPGKQKEYVLYLNEAKQEATKVKRLEKIKPMILEGVGLNDRYK